MKSLACLGPNLFRRMRRTIASQGGFTLIELLVVVAIMGALAAVAVPAVGKFANRGQGASKSTELVNVQAATDALMADLQLDTVNANVAASAAITNLSSGAGSWDLNPTAVVTNLYPGYMRSAAAIAGVGYCWDSTGKVTQKDLTTSPPQAC